MYRFCCKKQNFSLLSVTMFCNQQQPDLLQERFDLWVVKCATSPFNSLCSNIAKQVANHCCLFYQTLRSYLLSMLGQERGEGRGRQDINQNLMLILYFSHENLRMCSASDKRQRQKNYYLSALLGIPETSIMQRSIAMGVASIYRTLMLQQL